MSPPVMTAATLNLQGGGTNTRDAGPHVNQHATNVDDLRFARSVVNDSEAVRAYGSHEDGFRRSDTWKIQPDSCAMQARTGGV